MNMFEKLLISEKPLSVINRVEYRIVYIQPKIMDVNNSFGYFIGTDIFVHAGLPEKVQQFVIKHEVYHLKDKHLWWGWVGRELRANAVCGVKDPLGLLATITASLNRNRINAYWKTLKSVNFKQI